MDDDRWDDGRQATGPPAWANATAEPPAWAPAPAGPPDPSPDAYRDTRRQSIVARVCIGSTGVVALIAAVREGSVAMLNPFPARVANNKKLLALIGGGFLRHF